MTAERFLSAIFCDDVRREEGNKLSYMGVYGTNLLVPDFPIVLPKLCIALQMRTSPSPPKDVLFKLLRDDELIVERHFTAADLASLSGVVEDPRERSMQLIATIFQIFPLQLTGPCRFRARAICDGEEFKGGTLAVAKLGVVPRYASSERAQPAPRRPARKK